MIALRPLLPFKNACALASMGLLAAALIPAGLSGCKGREKSGGTESRTEESRVEGAERGAEAKEQGPDGKPKEPPTMAELHPIIRESQEEGVTPTAVTIEFSKPVVNAAGEPVSPKTVVKIAPEVEGTLAWQGVSTLAFSPRPSFSPDTTYTVTLEAVDTKDGLVRSISSGELSRVFTTPKFKHVRTSFSAFDPKRNRLEVEVVFSAPVDVSTIKGNATWTIDGLPAAKVNYERTERPNVARATIVDRRIEFGSVVRYDQDQGVRSASGMDAEAPSSSAEVKVHEGEPISIFAAHVHEGASGFYVLVVCKDEAVDGDDQYYWDDVVNQSFQISPRCVLEESDAAESVHFSPPVKFSISPTRGGFRILGNFARGSYSMRIDANARSMDGGVLKKPYRQTFSVPARNPQLSFVSQGRYLPKSAWSNLAIRHMNIGKAELVVRHIPLENLAFWMSGEQETADERTSNVLLKKKIPLRGEADTLTTSWVDVGAFLPAAPRGVLELQLIADGASAKSRLLITDINLVAKQEAASNRVWVWALDMHDNRPIPGVQVKQILRSGLTVSSCATDRLGGCLLEPREEKERELDPSAPFALVAMRENDMTYLKYDELKTEISDSLVHGRPFAAESPYRAALYSDRGVYRPGETAHVAAIVRGKDDVAPEAGMPVEVKLIDPRKKVQRKLVKKTNVAGAIGIDLKFDDFADTGSYQVLLEAGQKKIGEYGFSVEEFVPERMRVTAQAEKPELLATDIASFAMNAKYLFGGSAGGSRTEMSCELKPAVFSPKTNASYEYGSWRPEEKAAEAISIGSVTGALGDDGAGKLSCPALNQRGSFAGTARLVAHVAVFEAGSGRTTQADATALVHPESFYVGLSSGAKKLKAGQSLSVEGVIVDWSGGLLTGAGAEAAQKVELELFRIESENDWIYEDEEGRWSHRHYTRLASEGKLPPAEVKNGKFAASVTPGSDAGGFVLRARVGRAQTDLRFEGMEPYWWSWDGEEGRDDTPRPQKPASVLVHVPGSVKVGAPAKVKFESPFRGRALLSLETDYLISHEWMDVEAGGIEQSFAVPKFAPNVYVSVFIVKDPHLDSKESFLPSRAFGVSSVRVEPEEFTQAIKLDVPSEVRSNSKLEVKLDLGANSGPSVVTVAAVDEGILSLTKFASPDPLALIFDRRALGILTYETIGWNLLLPAGGTSRSEGGDEEGSDLGRVQPVKPVALWSGIVDVPESGRVMIPFDVPQYRGSLRVMAVAAGKKKMGSASANVVVRDPLVLQTTLPRFLSFGDNVEVPVFVTNLSGKAQAIDVRMTAEPLPVPGLTQQKALAADEIIQVKGGETKSLKLAHEGNGTVVFRVKALQAVGAAKLRVRVQAGDLASEESLDVPFVPAAPKTREVQTIELAEGRTEVRKYLKGWMPTTERSTLWVTSHPYGEAFDHLKYLIHYPYGCIEQTTSSTRPLLYLGNLVQSVDPALVAKDRIEAMVMAGLNRILSMQTPSGGFAYWPGAQEPTPWGTAYATHLLIDAQKLRYPVPEERVKDAIDWIERELTTRYEGEGAKQPDWYYWENAEAYMHYVLAMSGRGRKARIERLIQQTRPKSRSAEEFAEQSYMLKAALFMAGDHRYESDLRNPDVSPVTHTRSNGWSFYSDRRRRGFMLSVFSDLFGTDRGGEKLAALVAESLRGHPSSWYTTQEIVWGVTGLGKRIGEVSRGFPPATLIANGKELKPQDPGPGAKSSDRSWAIARASEYEQLDILLPKLEGAKVYLILSSEGVKQDARYKVGGEGLRLEREYVDQNGEPLSLTDGSIKLGAMIYAVLSVSNNTGERVQNIALVDRFPAGWEIENPRLGRGATSMGWIDKDELWTIDYMNLRDDRIEVFGALDRGRTAKIVYALRAVSAGQFMTPPAETEAMYYPDHWAREAGQRVVISPPWAGEGE